MEPGAEDALVPRGRADIDEGYRMYERNGPRTLQPGPTMQPLPLIEDWHMDPVRWTLFFQQYWHTAFYIAAVYLFFCWAGRRWMALRSPLPLDSALIGWNWALAVFSAAGAVRCGQEALYQVDRVGLTATLCNSVHDHSIPAIWHWYFAFSKVVELGDTFFIVGRKRPLQLLHWYHHVTVLAYSWHSGGEHTAAGRWFILVNFTVHAFMYAYFALKAHGVRVPKLCAMFVTLLQLSQMAVGVSITYTVYGIKSSGHVCQQSYANLMFATLIYASYFGLFLKFFLDAYVFNKKSKKID